MIQLENYGNTAIVKLNRPEKLNALNIKLLAELRSIITYLANDTSVYSVIITGEGDKAFAAGADISEINRLDETTAFSFSQSGQQVFSMIEEMEKPVIAAVNGYALGGGCELALACHIRIASETARFALPETGLGLIPGYGGTQRLSRLINQGRAFDYLLTGDLIDAQDALRMGLVSRVIPQADFLDKVRDIAKRIESKGQIAIRQAIKAIRASYQMPLEEGLKYEAQLFAYCCATDDFKEGTSAFIEKRKPNFLNQ